MFGHVYACSGWLLQLIVAAKYRITIHLMIMQLTIRHVFVVWSRFTVFKAINMYIL